MRFFGDIALAFRMLRKNPSLTVAALLAISLGIGANTVLFSVVEGVLLRPLNYPQADRIVELTRKFPGFDEAWSVAAAKFDFWRTHNRSFSAVAAISFVANPVNFDANGEPERVETLYTSSEYPAVMGVNPTRGRFFSRAEDVPNGGNYAVLTDAFWRSRLHRDSNVIGHALNLAGKAYTVIGIMPRGFESEPKADVLLPLQLAINPADHSNNYRVIARLKPGVTLAAAKRDMARVAGQFRQQYKTAIGPNESVGVVGYREWLTRGVRLPLLILLGAVGLVLLIACANVANLLLARSAAREQEIAIRTALGASRGRLIRQLLTESAVLSFAGAAGGLLLASLALPAVIAAAPANLPRASTIQLNWPVLVFTIVLSLATGILFGIVPAIQASRRGINNPLRESGTRTATQSSGNWIRQSLVVAEVALSLVLLAGAGLLLQTFVKLSGVNPGFDARNVLVLEMSINDARLNGNPAIGQMVESVATRLRTVNGVTSVAASAFLPLQIGPDLPFQIVGHFVDPDKAPDEFIRYVSPHYFDTMRMKLVAGRDFNRRDVLTAPPVAIVNEAFAQKYFPKTTALGQKLLIGAGMTLPFREDTPREIVGVVSDTHEQGLGVAPDPVMYESLAQVPSDVLVFDAKVFPLRWLIRTNSNPLAFAPEIRRSSEIATGGIPLSHPQTLEDVVGSSISQQQFLMTLLSVFAGLALFLGSIGLYGVLSYGVARRTRELGIRSALGANRSDLLALIVRQGMTMTGIGIVIGIVASLGLTQFLSSVLYGVTPQDPAVLIAVTAVLILVALAACLVPARRAASIDPVIALREQ
jgi:predicted permease